MIIHHGPKIIPGHITTNAIGMLKKLLILIEQKPINLRVPRILGPQLNLIPRLLTDLSFQILPKRKLPIANHCGRILIGAVRSGQQADNVGS